MLQAKLVEQGVDEKATEIMTDEVSAVARALKMANEGDLIMIFGDDITRTWKQIISFEAESVKSSQGDEGNSSQGFVEEDPLAFILDEGDELIRDERGVRIARSDEAGG